MFANWHGFAEGPIWIKPRWPEDLARGLFSFRPHGASLAPYTGLNVGLHVGDDPQRVAFNRQTCGIELGGSLEDWIVGEQVHGTNVAVVGQEDRGRGSDDLHRPVSDVDALVTDTPGLTLVVLTADCIPVLFFDPVKRVIATAHSGWKGTVGHIVRNVVETMHQQFGCRAEDIDVWMGPSIRQCCYEVSETVAGIVIDQFGWQHVVKRPNKPGKYLLNLHSCVRSDLLAAGVLNDRVHDTGVCTACHTDVLFSHRAEQGRTGRLLGAVRLV